MIERKKQKGGRLTRLATRSDLEIKLSDEISRLCKHPAKFYVLQIMLVIYNINNFCFSYFGDVEFWTVKATWKHYLLFGRKFMSMSSNMVIRIFHCVGMTSANSEGLIDH